MSALAGYEEALDALKSRGRYRSLVACTGHDFSSNDYLALAGSQTMREAAMSALRRGVGIGSGGSRLLRGNSPEHETLEREAADFFRAERALFFSCGFAANTAIFATLPRKGDLVLYDELIHASAHDGMRLGRAETTAFRHNDAGHAQALIEAWREGGGEGRVWLACESVYSMDGDFAPIAGFAALAGRHDAVLVVDEAHATGLFGDLGRGLSHSYADLCNIVTLHTCGKALGVSGALVCGAAPFIETLINKARGFIFSTAPSPLDAALVRAALDDLRENPRRRENALGLIAHAHREAEAKCGLSGFRSQIVPVVIGDDKKTMALAARMQERGFDIRGIRPPTVPRGTARLRISITLNASAETVSEMFAALAQERERIK